MVEGAALEMLCRATYRGFESHLLRQKSDKAVKILRSFNGFVSYGVHRGKKTP